MVFPPPVFTRVSPLALLPTGTFAMNQDLGSGFLALAGSSGRVMIRAPIGSIVPSGWGYLMRPGPMYVFLTVAVSTTLFHGAGLRAANQSAACFISSSVIADAIPFMRDISFLA